MKFEQDFLSDLVKGKSRGEFPPFSSGNWEKSDNYLKQIVSSLKDIKSIELDADFNHYGSGFSSYVHIYLSKRDQSDVKISINGKLSTHETNGLMIYLCRLAPFAVYSEGKWIKTYRDEKWQSGSSHYIEPEEIGTTPRIDWKHELIEINKVLDQFGMTFLAREELDIEIDFDITIPTILSDPPYKVFDCLFYWED